MYGDEAYFYLKEEAIFSLSLSKEANEYYLLKKQEPNTVVTKTQNDTDIIIVSKKGIKYKISEEKKQERERKIEEDIAKHNRKSVSKQNQKYRDKVKQYRKSIINSERKEDNDGRRNIG